jgi:hypothetical protein
MIPPEIVVVDTTAGKELAFTVCKLPGFKGLAVRKLHDTAFW